MKNKDGIEIIRDQKWTHVSGKDILVLGLYGDNVAVVEGSAFLNGYPENGDAFHRLLSCLVLGDMSKHLIVTDEQRKQYKKPKCVEYRDNSKEEWVTPAYGGWTNDDIYRVPEDHVWESAEKIEPVEEQCGGPDEACMKEGCLECGCKEIEPLTTCHLPIMQEKINELITAVNLISNHAEGK